MKNSREISFANMTECSKKIRKELNPTNEEIKEILMKDTKLDEQGRPIISKEDEWYYEDEWDRPCSVAGSIRKSLEEIKLYKQGKIKFKPIDDLLDQLEREIEEEEIYQGMRTRMADDFEKWEEENDRNNIR